MKEENIILNKTERPDSIEITKNAKGEYQFKAKIYGDNLEEDLTERAKKLVEKIESKFKKEE
jgi:hypothetical protein